MLSVFISCLNIETIILSTVIWKLTKEGHAEPVPKYVYKLKE